MLKVPRTGTLNSGPVEAMGIWRLVALMVTGITTSMQLSWRFPPVGCEIEGNVKQERANTTFQGDLMVKFD